jgi:hypothetical protein
MMHDHVWVSAELVELLALFMCHAQLIVQRVRAEDDSTSYNTDTHHLLEL